jgi:hypothetical protein
VKEKYKYNESKKMKLKLKKMGQENGDNKEGKIK